MTQQVAQMTQYEQFRAFQEEAQRMCHDLNNALSPILGFAEILLESDTLEDSEQAKRYLQLIRESGEEALRLSNSLPALLSTAIKIGVGVKRPDT